MSHHSHNNCNCNSQSEKPAQASNTAVVGAQGNGDRQQHLDEYRSRVQVAVRHAVAMGPAGIRRIPFFVSFAQ